MKNFVRATLILISIFSIFGIVFLGLYYIYKNSKKFRDLMWDFQKELSTLEKSAEKKTKSVVKEAKELSEKVIETAQNLEDETAKYKNENVLFQFNVAKPEVKTPIKKVSSIKRKNERAEKGQLNARQTEVLNYIKLNSEAKMSSVSTVFKKVTPRTLRRDLEKLEQMGFLKQEGKTRDAVYKIA